MDYEIANPDPAGTIASLSSLGYSVEAAIADLIDNSISANGRRIQVIFTWSGRNSWVAVVDDGDGMDESGLVTAMTVAARGPATDREKRDLGRFGMGLKTASFSQSRQLTVQSRIADSGPSIRTWDLESVAKYREWRLLKGADSETCEILGQVFPAGGSGTAVVWRHMHRFDVDGLTVADDAGKKQFYAEVARIERHLGMVFGRFLGDRRRLDLTVNGDRVRPWDPFLSQHPAVQRLPPEVIPVGGHEVNIAPFVLPQLRRLDGRALEAAAGPKGWLDQQGFYIYRRDRLILAGDWLGLKGFRRDERYNLARISVDIPAEADGDWRIDVRKSSAVPPVGIRRHLQRIGTATRDKASEVLNHRGKISARAHAADFVYAWKVERHKGQLRCRVNREHPLVKAVLRSGPDVVEDTRALIRLLEETMPVAALRTLHEADTADDPEPFAAAASDDATLVARRIYAALVNDGRTPREAKERIALMSPFNELDGFWRSGS